ncbi:hypothetical protein CesoFtcFv8_005769 [Champsocephalus esox]|uniref:Uncharacterized protein n=1 Tax=Champsocephalus esox TaxID=159716 RepID=A0AAN8H977_9TELE|nr:hypothetical protein CesoFtcFv8_005769 [Champsocephalus esox]
MLQDSSGGSFPSDSADSGRMLQDSSGGSFPSDSADSGRMLQDSRGEDPFHLTQQTQEGCFRTPEERILSI